MILWLCLGVLLVWTIIFRFRRRRLYQLASLVPAAKEDLPVIGLFHTVIGDNEEIMNTLKRFSYEAMEHNGIMKGWACHKLYFLLTNPLDVEMVLKTCLEKDDIHRFLRQLTGYGGAFAPVSVWRRRRKIMLPAFSPKVVENFVAVFSEQGEELVKHLATHINNGKFSVWPFLSSYALDSVCETAMGVKINAQGDPNSSVLKAINMALNLICKRIFHIWLRPDWLYKFFPQSYKQEQCVNHVNEFIDKVIEVKREELRNEKKCKTEADHHYGLRNYERKTFIDLLIALSGGEDGYNDVELREELLTLTIAGSDTSAVAMGFTLKLLGKYPQVQEKVFEELYDVFGESDRLLEKTDLPKLKYLERVVKESLRLFPPVPFIIRKVLEEIKLPSSGYTLPAGSGVVVSIWGAHRDPNYWGPDAEMFDPDRFLPERFNLKHPCSYMPFSNGSRNCIGYQYALISIKTVLSAILRRYRVMGEAEKSNVPRIRVKLDVMMKAVDGYQIILERRSKTAA